jgi:GDP-D-mannose dehydratase
MTNDNVALITGVTGQDGALLAELLLAKGSSGAPRRSTPIASIISTRIGTRTT